RLGRGAAESAHSLPSFGKTISDVVAAWKATFSRQPRQTPMPPRQPPGRRAVIMIFFIALSARLVMFGLINARGEEFFYRSSDGNEYLQVARNLLEGHGFSLQAVEPYLPYSYFAPGYPYLLAAAIALGVGLIPVILLQDVAGALTAVLVTSFGWRIVGRRAAILAGILLAVEPSTVFWNNQLVTESFSTILLIGAFFAVTGALRLPRLYRFAAAGTLLGLSTLVRHASQYLIPVFALASFWASGRRRFAGALLVLFFGIVFLIPWVIHNRARLGVATYSTAGGTLGLGKTLQYYATRKYGKSLPELFPEFYPETYLSNPEANQHVELYANRYPLLAWRVFRSDPLGLAGIYLRSFVPFFLGDGYAQIMTVAGGRGVQVIWDHRQPSLLASFIDRPDILPFMTGKITWAMLTGAALIGAAVGLARADSRPAISLAILVIGYYAVAAGVGGYSRFRFPVTPLILLLASSGIVTLASSLRRRRGFRRLLVVTQTVDLDHPVLGFFHKWIEELAARLPAVDVVALSAGRQSLPSNVRVFVPRRGPKVIRNASFLWQLARRIPASNGVFFHMCPEYAIAASPFFMMFGKRTLLWYTHRSVTRRLRISARLVDKVFTAALESCKTSSPRIEVTGHGIPVPPEMSRTPSPDFRILVVGRLTAIKEIGTVIEAVSLLRKRGLPAIVTIIGGPVYPADEAYAAHLRSRVDVLGIGPYTRFVGPMKHEDTLAAYRSADVLVNASPNGPDKVVYEAAAAGISVVAAHRAFRPLFGSHVDDLSFSVGDAAALADRLARLAAQSPDERAKIGAELRTAIIKDHSLSKLTDRITRFFTE
ncbi:hypothetical protein A2704_04565, partial [Candidatus Kaiserbacteria bacterium RIFCSPHIGHO2_01_FULL_54_36b]